MKRTYRQFFFIYFLIIHPNLFSLYLNRSCVNLHKQHWLKFKVDEPIDYSAADEILTLPYSARKPVQSKKSNKLNIKQTTVLVVLSAAAVLIISKWLMK